MHDETAPVMPASSEAAALLKEAIRRQSIVRWFVCRCHHSSVPRLRRLYSLRCPCVARDIAGDPLDHRRHRLGLFDDLSHRLSDSGLRHRYEPLRAASPHSSTWLD